MLDAVKRGGVDNDAKDAISFGYAPGLRRDVNGFVVNRGAPDLFPVMSLVKKEFTRREIEERRAFGRGGAICYNALKRRDILFLTNCPLN
jgi:hypothetical protein